MRRLELFLNISMIVVGVILVGTSLTPTEIEVPARAFQVEDLPNPEVSTADMATVPTDSFTPEPDSSPAEGVITIVPTPTDTPTPTPPAVSTPVPAPPTPTAIPATATPHPTPTLPPLPGTLNVVLLGSDRRPGHTDFRTDTIIVLMIDPRNKRVGVVSVHRDLWVNTATRGPTKINTLDEFGGPSLVKQGLSALLGIPIDYYVRIDFNGVVKAIDAIGGITIDADCSFTEVYPNPGAPGGKRTLYVPAGRARLTGQMALDYSRSRLSSSVTDRMKRQLKVLLGVREKLLSLDTFPRIPQLWEVTRSLVQTDLPPTMILSLAKLAAEMKLSDAHGLTLDGGMARQSYSPQGWWILVPDVTAVRAATRNILNAKPLVESVKRAGC